MRTTLGSKVVVKLKISQRNKKFPPSRFSLIEIVCMKKVFIIKNLEIKILKFRELQCDLFSFLQVCQVSKKNILIVSNCLLAIFTLAILQPGIRRFSRN